MSFLTEPLYDVVLFDGKKYHVNAAFDVVLDVQRLFREESLSEINKLQTALEIFGCCRYKRLSLAKQSELLGVIYDEQVKIRPRPKVGRQIKVVDFEADGEYIYASFLQDYGIDLIDVQGKLHWKKFMALFHGLSEKTKIKQIMEIRGREMPVPTKYNQDEIKNLMELKAYYALDYTEYGGQKGLSLLFSTLERLAAQ